MSQPITADPIAEAPIGPGGNVVPITPGAPTNPTLPPRTPPTTPRPPWMSGNPHQVGGSGGTPAPVSGGTGASGVDLTGAPDTFTQIIEQTLASWGLSSLNGLVESLGKTGAGQDEINLRIQNSPEYAARFAGNAQRVANGLSVLDPATYIGLEAQYRQILNDLPAGFYDSKADIDSFIGNNQSPAELSDKVQMADQIVSTGPSELRQAYSDYYGVSDTGTIIASILDPKVADPIIQQQFAAAQIGGTALQQGLGLTKSATAIKAAQMGVTLAQAQQAYQQIAGRIKTDQASSARFSPGGAGLINQDTEEQAGLLGNAGALKQQQLVGSEEASLFSGHGGSSVAANSPGANY